MTRLAIALVAALLTLGAGGVGEAKPAKASGAKIDYIDPSVWMEKNGAELLRLHGDWSSLMRAMRSPSMRRSIHMKISV